MAVRRRVLWLTLGAMASAVGAYAAAGLALGLQYDKRVASFAASGACAEMQGRRRTTAEENGAPILAQAWDVYQRIEEEQILFLPDEIGNELGQQVAAASLRATEPFLALVERAAEKPVPQFPDGSPAGRAMDKASEVLGARARLEPEHAAESADVLLRLAAAWRPWSWVDPLDRARVLEDALRIVQDLLANDPEQAKPRLGAWRHRLAAEDPLGDFRFSCAALLDEWPGTLERTLRGEDPFAEARAPWYFHWYARPVLYWHLIADYDLLLRVIDGARTEAGLRALLSAGVPDTLLSNRCAHALEHCAVLHVARAALALAAGEAEPQLPDDPFTGQPLSVRREDGATVISATSPRDATLLNPGLVSWTVER